jgi:hypothetical protein
MVFNGLKICWVIFETAKMESSCALRVIRHDTARLSLN